MVHAYPYKERTAGDGGWLYWKREYFVCLKTWFYRIGSHCSSDCIVEQ